MPLTAVHMPADVYYACSLHALSFEEEEIMGLLIGKFEDNNAYVKSTIVLQRSDKRKDRVEISTEQLDSAMMKTSELTEKMNEPINVLGWYHSHPHITIQPSQVDLRTQASYQTMDIRFFGIIISVFNEDKLKGQEIQITCFQAISSNYTPYQKVEIPLYIEGVQNFSSLCAESIFQLPHIISQEDHANYDEILQKYKNNYISKLQNDSAFVMSQCHILTSIANPLLLNAELRLLTQSEVIKDLEEERDSLLRQLGEVPDKERKKTSSRKKKN